MTTATRQIRHRLISLKWELSHALDAGATLDEIAAELGRSWTPELIIAAFPDLARKHGLERHG